MINKFYELLKKGAERIASNSDEGLRLSREGRLLFEKILRDLGSYPIDATPEQRKAARQNHDLQKVISLYEKASEYARMNKKFYDESISNYQLGMVKYIQGYFDEAKLLFHNAINILDDLPINNRKIQYHYSNCYFHLGFVWLKDKRDLELNDILQAQIELKKSLDIDTLLSNKEGIKLCKEGLSLCEKLKKSMSSS